MRAAVRVRLAHVPREIRPILETAAVLGRRFDFDTLLEVTREPEEPLLAAVEALVRRRLLREEPEGGVYDFSHDKVREVVYRDIGGARRRLLHQSVAKALERRGEGETHERDAKLAEHYERAHVWSKALRYLLLAGEHSQALFSMRDALHWLDRAVALSESHPESLRERQRLAIYERRGAARAQAGQTQGAVADVHRVIDVMRAGGERERTRDALIQLGMAYRRADAYEEATACLTEALAECRAMNDEHHAADTLYHLGTVAWSTGLNDQAIGFHQQAVEICERTGFADLVAVQALPWPRRGTLRERRARGGDLVLHTVARSCPRHGRGYRPRAPPDGCRGRAGTFTRGARSMRRGAAPRRKGARNCKGRRGKPRVLAPRGAALHGRRLDPLGPGELKFVSSIVCGGNHERDRFESRQHRRIEARAFREGR